MKRYMCFIILSSITLSKDLMKGSIPESYLNKLKQDSPVLDDRSIFTNEVRSELPNPTPNTRSMFIDPLGNGGMITLNEGGYHFISKYPDANNTIGQSYDYNCGGIRTSDQYKSTDIEIGGFYYMDEMSAPVLAAASGIVSFVHDGEYDRWRVGQNSSNAVPNRVTISHPNGYTTTYDHLKKNSILVSLNQNVEAGDTIAYVGSSGQSTIPHLGFEISNTLNQSYKNPWEGDCSNGTSLWQEQIPYIADTSINKRQLIQYTHSAYPVSVDPDVDFNGIQYILDENIPNLNHLNPGEVNFTILYITNLLRTDTLKHYRYFEESLVYSTDWIPGESEWWYYGNNPAPKIPWFWYGPFNQNLPLGNYRDEVFINDSLVGSNNYIVDDIPNQLPAVTTQIIQVDSGQEVEGEFTGMDDGDVFFYEIESQPANGTIEVYGGRNRKYKYTAPENFNGSDIINVYAIDDRGVNGASSLIVFVINGSLGNDNSVKSSSFSLGDAYPNPFNPLTTIKYDLPMDSYVMLNIYDVLGNVVNNLVSKKENHGSKLVQWDATDNQGKPLSSGVYFYKIQAGKFIQTKKIILLK